MIFYWLTVFLFKLFGRIFLRLKVEGRENLPLGKGFILVANHASSLDPFIITASIPRYIRWIVIYEYYDLWYLRWLLRKMRFIRVENNLPKAAYRALLQQEVVGVFPEGRRSWDGQLGQTRPGVAYLARKASCAVVPVAIKGTFEALPRTRKLLKLHPVTVRIGRPLFFPNSANTKGNQNLDRENTHRIMQVIAGLIRG